MAKYCWFTTLNINNNKRWYLSITHTTSAASFSQIQKLLFDMIWTAILCWVRSYLFWQKEKSRKALKLSDIRWRWDGQICQSAKHNIILILENWWQINEKYTTQPRPMPPKRTKKDSLGGCQHNDVVQNFLIVHEWSHWLRLVERNTWHWQWLLGSLVTASDS